MRLYVLRHGRAVEFEHWHGTEPERPLTEKGRAELRRVARGLKRLGVAPDVILSSPFTRAWDTAMIVGAALHIAPTPAQELEPGGELEGLTALLATLTREHPLDSALLVGHEPGVSQFIGHLIGRDGSAHVEMRKASCARVDVTGEAEALSALAGQGTLVWLLRAKHLVQVGG